MEGVGKKGTALSIDRTVDCLYNMKDNLDMKQGTVSHVGCAVELENGQ